MEPIESVQLSLNSSPDYELGASDYLRQAAVTILDDDGVVIAAGPDNPSENGDVAFFTITRPSLSVNQESEVYYYLRGEAVHGEDYYLSSSATELLTDTVNNLRAQLPIGQSSVNVYVWPLDDEDFEGPESIELELFQPQVSNYNLGEPYQATLLLEDNETTIAVGSADKTAAENGPNIATFTVTRTGQITQPLYVPFRLIGAATRNEDYTISHNQIITIPAGVKVVTLTVTPLDDSDVEMPEDVTLLLLRERPITYDFVDANQATIVINDNEGNQPPIPYHSIITITQDTPGYLDPYLSFYDPNADPVFLSVATTPNNGDAGIITDTITYIPADGFLGTDNFAITVDDGRGGTTQTNVQVHVVPHVAPDCRPTTDFERAYMIRPDQPFTVDLTEWAEDYNGDALTFTLSDQSEHDEGVVQIINSTLHYSPTNWLTDTRDSVLIQINDGQEREQPFVSSIEFGASSIVPEDGLYPPLPGQISRPLYEYETSVQVDLRDLIQYDATAPLTITLVFSEAQQTPSLTQTGNLVLDTGAVLSLNDAILTYEHNGSAEPVNIYYVATNARNESAVGFVAFQPHVRDCHRPMPQELKNDRPIVLQLNVLDDKGLMFSQVGETKRVQLQAYNTNGQLVPLPDNNISWQAVTENGGIGWTIDPGDPTIANLSALEQVGYLQLKANWGGLPARGRNFTIAELQPNVQLLAPGIVLTDKEYVFPADLEALLVAGDEDGAIEWLRQRSQPTTVDNVEDELLGYRPPQTFKVTIDQSRLKNGLGQPITLYPGLKFVSDEMRSARSVAGTILSVNPLPNNELEVIYEVPDYLNAVFHNYKSESISSHIDSFWQDDMASEPMFDLPNYDTPTGWDEAATDAYVYLTKSGRLAKPAARTTFKHNHLLYNTLVEYDFNDSFAYQLFGPTIPFLPSEFVLKFNPIHFRIHFTFPISSLSDFYFDIDVPKDGLREVTRIDRGQVRSPLRGLLGLKGGTGIRDTVANNTRQIEPDPHNPHGSVRFGKQGALTVQLGWTTARARVFLEFKQEDGVYHQLYGVEDGLPAIALQLPTTTYHITGEFEFSIARTAVYVWALPIESKALPVPSANAYGVFGVFVQLGFVPTLVAAIGGTVGLTVKFDQSYQVKVDYSGAATSVDCIRNCELADAVNVNLNLSPVLVFITGLQFQFVIILGIPDMDKFMAKLHKFSPGTANGLARIFYQPKKRNADVLLRDPEPNSGSVPRLQTEKGFVPILITPNIKVIPKLWLPLLYFVLAGDGNVSAVAGTQLRGLQLSGIPVSHLEAGVGLMINVELEGAGWLLNLLTNNVYGIDYANQFLYDYRLLVGYPLIRGDKAPTVSTIAANIVWMCDQGSSLELGIATPQEIDACQRIVERRVNSQQICSQKTFNEDVMDANGEYLAYSESGQYNYDVYCKKVEDLQCPLGEQTTQNTFDAYYRKIASSIPTRYYAFRDVDVRSWMKTLEVYIIRQELPQDDNHITTCSLQENIFAKVGEAQRVGDQPSGGEHDLSLHEWRWHWADRDVDEFPDGRYTFLTVSRPSIPFVGDLLQNIPLGRLHSLYYEAGDLDLILNPDYKLKKDVFTVSFGKDAEEREKMCSDEELHEDIVEETGILVLTDSLEDAEWELVDNTTCKLPNVSASRDPYDQTRPSVPPGGSDNNLPVLNNDKPFIDSSLPIDADPATYLQIYDVTPSGKGGNVRPSNDLLGVNRQIDYTAPIQHRCGDRTPITDSFLYTLNYDYPRMKAQADNTIGNADPAFTVEGLEPPTLSDVYFNGQPVNPTNLPIRSSVAEVNINFTPAPYTGTGPCTFEEWETFNDHKFCGINVLRRRIVYERRDSLFGKIFVPIETGPWETIRVIPNGRCSAFFVADPHIATMDGLRYESYSLGEFTYLEPVPEYSGNAPVTIQVRQDTVEGWTRSGSLSTASLEVADWVSWVTALAAEMDGYTFEFSLPGITGGNLGGGSLNPLIIRIDGQEQDLDPGLYTYGEVELIVESDQRVRLIYGEHRINLIVAQDAWLEAQVISPQDDSHHGMLGRPNSDSTDDFLRRDGQMALDQYDLGNSWRITQTAHSLFTYEPNEGPHTFNRPQAGEPPSLQELRPYLDEAQNILESTCNPSTIDEARIREAAIELYIGRTPEELLEVGICHFNLQGQVLNHFVDDLPVPGARITATMSSGATCSTFTDRFGYYSCPVPSSGQLGDITIEVSGRGSAQATVTPVELPPATGYLPLEQHFVVSPTTIHLTGTVTDGQTSFPLYDAQLRVTGPDNAGFVKAFGRSDGFGQYSTYIMVDDGVTGGNINYFLTYSPPGQNALDANRVRKDVDDTLPSLNQNQLNIVPKDIELSGVVLDLSGRVSYLFDDSIPVEGMRVLISPTLPHPQFTSPCDITTLILVPANTFDPITGRDTFDPTTQTKNSTEAGLYRCQIPIEDVTPFDVQVKLIGNDLFSIVFSQTVNIDPAGVATGAIYQAVMPPIQLATPVVYLTGIAYGPNNQPLAGVHVTPLANNSLGSGHYDVTDVNGRYSLYLPLEEGIGGGGVNGTVDYKASYFNADDNKSQNFTGVTIGVPYTITQDFTLQGSALTFYGRVIDTRTNELVYGSSTIIRSPDFTGNDQYLCGFEDDDPITVGTGRNEYRPDAYVLPPAPGQIDPPQECRAVVEAQGPDDITLVYETTAFGKNFVYTHTLPLADLGQWRAVPRDLHVTSITPTLTILSGTVSRPSGLPLEQATVYVDVLDNNGNSILELSDLQMLLGNDSDPRIQATTDANGYYETSVDIPHGMTSGSFAYEVVYRTLSITDTQPFTIVPQTTNVITRDLTYPHRTVYLQGTFTNTYGIDMPYTSVILESDNLHTNLGNLCQTQIDPKGRFVCVAQTKATAPISITLTAQGDWGVYSDTVTALIDSNAETVEYNFTPQAVNLTVLNLRGQVTNNNGDPLPEVEVTVSSSDLYRVAYGQTNDQGAYDLFAILKQPSQGNVTQLNGAINFFAGYGEEGEARITPYSVDLYQSATITEDFSLDLRVVTFRGTIFNGYILDALENESQSEPAKVYGSRVLITSPTYGRLCEYALEDAFSDNQYECHARVFSSEPFSVTYRLTGEWGAATIDGNVTDVPDIGQRTTVQRLLRVYPTTLTLAGQATDRDGRPLEGANITINSPNFTGILGTAIDRSVTTATGEDGYYTAYATVRSEANRSIDLTYETTFEQGQETVTMNTSKRVGISAGQHLSHTTNFAFPHRKVTVSGNLINQTDPDTRLEGDLTIFSPTFGDTLCQQPITSDEAYECDYLVLTDTNYLLHYTVTGDWGSLTLPPQTIPGSDTTVQQDIPVAARQIRLNGQVTRPDNEPLPEADVTISSYTILNGQRVEQSITTDETGDYNFVNLLGPGVSQVIIRYTVDIEGNQIITEEPFSFDPNQTIVTQTKQLIVDTSRLTFGGDLINALMGTAGLWSKTRYSIFGNNEEASTYVVVSSPSEGLLCTAEGVSTIYQCTATINTTAAFDVHYEVYGDWGTTSLVDRVTAVPPLGGSGFFTKTMTVTPTMLHIHGTAQLTYTQPYTGPNAFTVPHPSAALRWPPT